MAKKKTDKETAPASDHLIREGLAPCEYYLSTGSTLLDLAISDRHPGGVGGGRVTHIYGDNSTAKSVLCQQIMGSAQRLEGGQAVYEDVEWTLDLDRAKLFGLDIGKWATADAEIAEAVPEDWDKNSTPEAFKVDDKFTFRRILTIEDLFDGDIHGLLKKVEKSPHPVAVGVDTISALPPKSELETGMEDGTYGTSRAKQYSLAFRKYLSRMASAGLTMIAIDQTREKINAPVFAKKHTVGGGKAMGYYASTRVLLNNLGKIKNSSDAIIGVKIGFEIEKNKIAPPFRKGWFDVIFDYGIDDLSANLDWLKEQSSKELLTGPITVPTKGWFEFDGQKLQKNNLITYIEQSNQEETIRQEVARVWKLIHKTPDRKPRYD